MFALRRIRFALFIQTAKTPNPNFLKFVPVSEKVLGAADPIDFTSPEEANARSPFARRLFRIRGITQVLLGKEFVSVAKSEEVNWNDLKPQIFEAIESHYSSGEPVVVEPAESTPPFEEGDSEKVKVIKSVLVSRVKPFVQDDGGDVCFVKFEEETGVLSLKMLGSCSGCPSSQATLKGGILKMMQHYVGGVNDVVAVE